jgi:16S rRNA (cytidine1402-2'-O)-methyltransferase
VVVGPPEAGEAAGRAIALDDQLRTALKRLSLRDAAAAVATATGLPKREVYARALALAGADVEDGAEDGRP